MIRSFIVLILFTMFILVLAVLIPSCSSDGKGQIISLEKDSQGKTITWSTPESFIYSTHHDCYFISNINGSPLAEDDNGFIVKLDGQLKLIDNHFVDGKNTDYSLNAPKGMTVVGDKLWVSDINMVRVFSAVTGKLEADVDFSNFKVEFLNDLTSDPAGNIYVSDMFTDRIFLIDSLYKISFLDSVVSPNGLCFHNDGYLLVANWEPPKVTIQYLDGKSQEILIDERLKNLDGIDIDKNGDLIFSDFTAGTVYKYSIPEKKLTEIASGLKRSADISIDRKNNYLLIPQFSAEPIIYTEF